MGDHAPRDVGGLDGKACRHRRVAWRRQADENAGLLEGLAQGGARQATKRAIRRCLRLVRLARPTVAVIVGDAAAGADIKPRHEARGKAAPPHQCRKTRRTLAQQDEAGGVARPHAAARRSSYRCFLAQPSSILRRCTPGLGMDVVLAWMMARTEI